MMGTGVPKPENPLTGGPLGQPAPEVWLTQVTIQSNFIKTCFLKEKLIDDK